jgi:DNA repair protein RadC
LIKRTSPVRGTLMMDMPATERPRERLLRSGVHVLSTAELIALLIGTGSRGESALALAERVLVSTGGLLDLMDVDPSELTKIHGVGKVKAIAILAAVELGRRVQSSQVGDLRKITSPDDVAAYLMERLRFLRKEHFIAIHLNTKHQILGEEIVSIGSLNASIVHPREIFKTALKRSAAAIICAHNHPSGDPTPSEEDVEVTRRLVSAGKILGVEVLDHIVIGDKRFISLRERGLMAV